MPISRAKISAINQRAGAFCYNIIVRFNIGLPNGRLKVNNDRDHLSTG